MKTSKSQMIERLVRIRKIGLSIGKVTSRNARRAPDAVDRGGLEQLARHLRRARRRP